MRENNFKLRILHLQKLFLKNETKIKIFGQNKNRGSLLLKDPTKQASEGCPLVGKMIQKGLK